MIKQNPFSIYDFLGYFIPGALMIYIILFLLKIHDFNNLDQFTTVLNNDRTFQLDSFLFFIIISYSTGHLINFISSITIERYANWKYDYPSKYLMNLNKDFKFWSGSKKIKSWKFILILILSPITLFDYILGEIFCFKIFYTKNADKYIIAAVKSKGVILLNQLGTPTTKKLREYDFHRIFSHYVYENSKNHQSKLSNYVALFGFLRALSLISALFSWLIFYKLCEKVFLCDNYIEYFTKSKYLIRYLFIISITSYVFFMAFMKFYRRYTLETLMLIVIDKDLVDLEKKREKLEE